MPADQPPGRPDDGREAEQEAVRRLLADARVDADDPGERLPDHVAARLDGRLAELVEQQDGGSASDAANGAPTGPNAPAAPADLAVHRRRRRRAGAALLLAAAAVVVVGVGVRALVGGPATEQSDMSPQTGADRGAADASSPSATPPPAGAEEGNGLTLQDRRREGDGTGDDDADEVGLPTIRPLRFVADVRAVRRVAVAADSLDYLSNRPAGPDDVECDDADFGRGALIAVEYRSAPAVLALRRPTSDTQVADLLQCGSGDVVRSTTLSLR